MFPSMIHVHFGQAAYEYDGFLQRLSGAKEVYSWSTIIHYLFCESVYSIGRPRIRNWYA